MTEDVFDFWFNHSIIRPIILAAIIITLFIVPFYFFAEKPMIDGENKMIADDKAKTKAEHDKLVSMNCQDLGNWLLQDNWYNRDNLIYAQNHYLVECKNK